MIFYRSRQAGVTLIEVVLVLIIAIAITLMGLRIYSGFDQDNMVRKAQFNVDQLFQAAGLYYQANCRGILNPNNSPAAVIPLTISTNLQAPGFLPNWSPQVNTVVDTTTFSVQLEQYSGPRMPSGGMYYNNWVTTPPFETSFTTNVGYVNFWVVHVAVKLQSGLNPSAYQARLFATCSANSPTTLCSTSPGAGSYMIWERLPAFASPSGSSNLIYTMPRVKAFTNLYNTDDMYGAYNPTWGASTNNYLCGG